MNYKVKTIQKRFDDKGAVYDMCINLYLTNQELSLLNRYSKSEILKDSLLKQTAIVNNCDCNNLFIKGENFTFVSQILLIENFFNVKFNLTRHNVIVNIIINDNITENLSKLLECLTNNFDKIANENNFEILFNAYNYYIDNDMLSNGLYIFDLENKNDIIRLCKLNILPIHYAHLLKERFIIININGDIITITKEKILDIIKEFSTQILIDMLRNPHKQYYKEIYEKLIVNNLD